MLVYSVVTGMTKLLGPCLECPMGKSEVVFGDLGDYISSMSNPCSRLNDLSSLHGISVSCNILLLLGIKQVMFRQYIL